MSSILNTRLGAHGFATRSWTARATSQLKRWWIAYLAYRKEQAALTLLSGMTDRELKDIGVTRSDLWASVSISAARQHPLGRYY